MCYLPVSDDVHRSMNLLWMPDYLSKCHNDLTDAFEMTETEKLLILGRFITFCMIREGIRRLTCNSVRSKYVLSVKSISTVYSCTNIMLSSFVVRILCQIIENSAHETCKFCAPLCEFCANSAHFFKPIFPLYNYQWHSCTTLFATLVYVLSLI